jgi:hypothetical protein
MDLHTTNGTRHAYMLTYSPPLHPGTEPALVGLLRNEWLPWVTRTIHDKYRWDYYYYGNVSNRPDGERRWATFDHRPRFNNNYVGLRNRFAVLSEAYAYASFQDRIVATSRFVSENLAFVHAHADRIRNMAAAADRSRIIATRLPLRAELQDSGTIDVLMGEVAEEKHPVDGHVMHVRKDVKLPEKMADYSTFRGIEMERVPAAYYVPASLSEAIDRLTAHGVVLKRTATAAKLMVEEFTIEAAATAPTPFQNHNERTLKGTWAAAEREIAAGTVTVDLSQPLGRLAFYLIEPRSDDGLANWNLLDEALKDAKTYPILRSRH